MKAKEIIVVSAALAGLVAGTGIAAARSNFPPGLPSSFDAQGTKDCKGSGHPVKEKHVCKGQNTCKGKGGCNSSDNGCKGKNTCKGKGGCATDGSKMPSDEKGPS